MLVEAPYGDKTSEENEMCVLEAVRYNRKS